MKIGFDVSQTGQFKTGCGYYADSLARHLITADSTNQYILYPTFGSGYWDPRWSTSTLRLPDRPNVSRATGQRRLDLLESFWMDPSPNLERRLGSPDIIHSNNFFCPTSIRSAHLVYTLYDLSFITHPEWTSEANWRTCFDGVFNASVHADHIIAISEYTRRQFLETFPHYPQHQVSVVYGASRFAGPDGHPPPQVLRHLTPGQFWLGVGAQDPRKNYLRLVEAYAQLKSTGQTSFPLLLVGGGGPVADDLDMRIQSLQLTGDVQRLGYVDDASLQWLYENCFAFCYPSMFEGFGLPVVEAMSLGAATLTSNVTSLPEVVGDSGIVVDPDSVEAISAGMRLLSSDSSLCQRLRARALVRAAGFSWRSAAARVLQIYQMLNTSERQALLGAAET